MSAHPGDPGPDPRSPLEDQGIPDLEDGAPERERASDPEEPAVPRDVPSVLDDFGTTAEEQREGEPLDKRLSRERPEVPPQSEPADPKPAGRLVRPSADEPEDGAEVAADAGADSGGMSAEEQAMHVDEEG